MTVPTVDRLGRPAGERALLVRPEHRDALARFCRSAARRARWLLPGLGAWLALAVLASRALGPTGLGAGLVLLGALLFALPYATPETVWMLGVRRSVLVARGCAVALAVAGALVVLLSLAR